MKREEIAWEYNRKRGYHRQKSVEGSVENEQGEPVSEAHRIIAALERLEKQQSEIKVALDGLIGYVVEQDRDEVEVEPVDDITCKYTYGDSVSRFCKTHKCWSSTQYKECAISAHRHDKPRR